jgi:hypothetical protein
MNPKQTSFENDKYCKDEFNAETNTHPSLPLKQVQKHLVPKSSRYIQRRPLIAIFLHRIQPLAHQKCKPLDSQWSAVMVLLRRKDM